MPARNDPIRYAGLQIEEIDPQPVTCLCAPDPHGPVHDVRAFGRKFPFEAGGRDLDGFVENGVAGYTETAKVGHRVPTLILHESF